jgi:hypothetical protein
VRRTPRMLSANQVCRRAGKTGHRCSGFQRRCDRAGLPPLPCRGTWSCTARYGSTRTTINLAEDSVLKHAARKTLNKESL